MLWAAASLCFFRFLHSGEVVSPSELDYDSQTHLCFSDVRVDSRQCPACLEVTIKASKTDPFRQGFTLHLGVTQKRLCPVTALLQFMVYRGNSLGLLFKWRSGKYLTGAKFVSSLRAALKLVGMDESKFAGHSFRIGAATTAAQCGWRIS